MSAHQRNVLHWAARETKDRPLEIRHDYRLQLWLLRDRHYQNKYKNEKRAEADITFTLRYQFLFSEKIQSTLRITVVVTGSLRVPGKLLPVWTSGKKMYFKLIHYLTSAKLSVSNKM